MGLGNPGEKYAATRHNAGFWFVDELARANGAVLRAENKFSGEVARIRGSAGDCWLLKPMTYMNHSGRAVSALCNFYCIQPANLLVVYDELDLAPGMMRLKQGGGHGGHNGMRDIFRHLTDKDFLRLRIGIGHPGHKDAVTPWVLGRPTAEQERLIRDSIADSASALPLWLDGNLPGAMKKLHTAD